MLGSFWAVFSAGHVNEDSGGSRVWFFDIT